MMIVQWIDHDESIDALKQTMSDCWIARADLEGEGYSFVCSSVVGDDVMHGYGMTCAI